MTSLLRETAAFFATVAFIFAVVTATAPHLP